MTKRWIAALLMALLLLPSAHAEAPEKPIVYYFYENYCGSCHPDEEFVAEFKALTGEALSQYSYFPYNVAQDSGMAKLDEVAAEFGIDEPLIPLVIVDGDVFLGSSAIQSGLPAYGVARAESTQSVLYYLYVDGCADCAKVKEVLDALPATIAVTRGSYQFDSEVVIHRVNIMEDSVLANALFEAYKVPEEKRYAPLILAAERYYEGFAAIDRFLIGAIYRAGAMNTMIVKLP